MNRIATAEVFPISLPDPPLLNASGLHAPVCTRLVVLLHDEQGRRGLAEIPSSPACLEALQQALPLLVGMDPMDRHGLWAQIEPVLSGYTEERGDQTWDDSVRPHVRSAVEVAALDLAGHILNMRVVDLLGGPHRQQVEVAGYLFFKYAGSGAREVADDPWFRARDLEALDATGVLAQAAAMHQRYGFQSFKLKGGILDPEVEVAACEALAEVWPIRFDPNAVWRPETALRYADRLRPCLEYLEDPVRGQEAMADFRRQTGIRLATNMCTTTPAELRDSLVLGCEDIVLCDHHFWGGLTPCMALSTMAPALGRELSFHSNSHGGISMAAATHLGCAMPALDHPIDVHYPWQDGDDVVAGGSFPLRDGVLRLPEGPGLGVQLDEKAFAAARARYEQLGSLQRDDETEMRNVDPEWSFQRSRY